MIPQQHNEEYLFFHTVETFYNSEGEPITNNEFLTKLSANERVSVEKTEIKLLYNTDKSKLKLVIFNQNKAFVELKNPKIKKIVPKKQKIYTGFTIDLIRKNVYPYIISNKPKVRTKTKKIRCNVFFDHIFTKLDKITNYWFNQKQELVDILCQYLQLKPDYYANASEILSAYYLHSRKIEYYNVDNLKYFMNLFQIHRKKYINTDIYGITQNILKIKEIRYVKLFYEQKQCESMFYYMVLFDLFGMGETDIYDENNFNHFAGFIPFHKIERIRFFFNKLNSIYFFRYEDFMDYHQVDNYLEILNRFYTFGYKLNVEKLKTINKINRILTLIVQKMIVALYEEGYILHNTESIEVISKHLGDGYRVNYHMYPKGYFDMLEHNQSSYNYSFVKDLTHFTIQRYDGVIKEVFFNTNHPEVFYYKNKSMFLEDQTSKFGLLIKKYKNNFESYYKLFSSTICFSEERLLSLCKEDENKINPNKYISKL